MSESPKKSSKKHWVLVPLAIWISIGLATQFSMSFVAFSIFLFFFALFFIAPIVFVMKAQKSALAHVQHKNPHKKGSRARRAAAIAGGAVTGAAAYELMDDDESTFPFEEGEDSREESEDSEDSEDRSTSYEGSDWGSSSDSSDSGGDSGGDGGD